MTIQQLLRVLPPGSAVYEDDEDLILITPDGTWSLDRNKFEDFKGGKKKAA